MGAFSIERAIVATRMNKDAIKCLYTFVIVRVDDIKRDHATCSSDLHARYEQQILCVR